MGATTIEIEQRTRAALISKSDYARLFGISAATATKQARAGRLETVSVGGREFVKTEPLRRALGLPQVEAAQ